MARKPTLSPSKISTYLACRVKYRWTYVDARGRWYLRAKAHYSFGLTLHKVLEAFYAKDRDGVPTTDEIEAAMEENWVDAGYASQEEMMEARGEGLAILQGHVQQEAARPRVGRTFLIETTLKLVYEDFELVGRLDRVDEMPDGSLEIVDYKSGRETVVAEDVAGSLAMSIYQLLVRRTYPDRAVSATLIALRTGQRASATLSDAELTELERDLGQLGAAILTDDYAEIEPRPKPLCRGCDFLPLCRQHPDFAEAWSDRFVEA